CETGAGAGAATGAAMGLLSAGAAGDVASGAAGVGDAGAGSGRAGDRFPGAVKSRVPAVIDRIGRLAGGKMTSGGSSSPDREPGGRALPIASSRVPTRALRTSAPPWLMERSRQDPILPPTGTVATEVPARKI